MLVEAIATAPERIYSPDFEVTFRPAKTFSGLAQELQVPTAWAALKRPLFLAFFLGCVVSFITAQRLTLRLVVTGSLNMSFVPLVEVLALFIVWRRHRVLPFSRAIDVFFTGHGPWIVGLLGYSAVWALATPEVAFHWTVPERIWLILLFALLWSAYIDYQFFRHIFARGRAQAGFDLLVQRLVSWSVGILIFGAGPIPPHIAKVFHR